MASSPTEVANSALVRIGSDRIDAITDDNARAKIMNSQYNKTRKALLRSHPWNFAKKRVEVGLLVEEPLFDYDYYYELPTDCLRVLAINDPDAPWIVEHDHKLATDATNVEILYIADITDTQMFDPHFDEAFAAQLAADTSFAFTQNAAFRKELRDEATRMVNLARSFNAQEGTPPTVSANAFWRVRF